MPATDRTARDEAAQARDLARCARNLCAGRATAYSPQTARRVWRTWHDAAMAHADAGRILLARGAQLMARAVARYL